MPATKRPRSGGRRRGENGEERSEQQNPKQAAHRRRVEEDEAQEERLAAALFGSGKPFDAVTAVDHEEEDDNTNEDDIGAAAGAASEAAWEDDDDEDLTVDISARARLRKLRAEEGEGAMTGGQFQERLRERFENSQVSTAWVDAAEKEAAAAAAGREAGRRTRAGSDSDSDEDEGDEAGLLRTTDALGGERGSGGKLEAGHLDVMRCKDANQQAPSNAVVQSVHFHPAGQLLLTAGYDKTLRFFEIDGVKNPKVHGVHFPDLPIKTAAFVGKAGDQVLAAGRRPFFYCYDVESGQVQKIARLFSCGGREAVKQCLERFAVSPDGRWLAFPLTQGGVVLLVSNASKQWVADLKVNGSVGAVSFSQDSEKVYITGMDGDVYHFDVRSRRCLLRYFNEGGTGGTSLALSPNSPCKYTAVGSESGVVNIYDNASLLGTTSRAGGKAVGVRRPSPLKAVMNLTTSVTALRFNADSQVLAMASNEKRDALKLVHLPSCTVFSNWPTERTPIRYAHCLDFSAQGGYLAVGNDRGRVLLYRLKHYTDA